MKKCPFCAEMIQDEAVKCRYCGEFLVPPEHRPRQFRSSTEPVSPTSAHYTPPAAPAKKKWYHNTIALIVMFCVIGPFVIPMVWTNPSYSKQTKVVLISVMVVLSIVLLVVFVWTMKWEYDYMKNTLKGIDLCG